MAADTRPVAVMDSGVGGLPYLAAAAAILPAESFVYLADRAGYPYGTKPRAEVQAAVLDRVARLRSRFDPKALVIACNTASQAALAAVRAANPGFPVVGTVPAVKPAAERTRSGVIGVMATAGAVGDPYLDSLVARFAPGVRVLREAAQDLVSFVESRLPEAGADERRAAVAAHALALVHGGADEIVLACTHFLHVSGDIAAAAGPGVEVVDSRDGVARRLRQVLSERGIAAAPRGRPPAPGPFLLSGSAFPEQVYARFATRFGLAAPSLLDGR